MDENESPNGQPPAAQRRERELIDAARRQARPERPAAEPPDGTLESVTLEPSTSTEPSFEGPPPDSFAGYQIVKELHRGGQGVVYQAIQKSTKRKVAIKVMKEGPFASVADKARFDREVQVLGQLQHPNIVAIHDSGVAAGCHYFVMDYISGQPLDVYMAGAAERHEGTKARRHVGRDKGTKGRRDAEGRLGLSVESTLRLFAKICEAVNAAHLRGVIHRDLKPGNIRMDPDGEPHILDFGLAKVAVSTGPETGPPGLMTMTGQFIGSLPWASPEQAEGMPSKIDIRTDVYSLGVVLYQMLTGKFPYEVIGNMRDVLDRIMRTEPVRPSTVGWHGRPGRGINDEVETIVLKCLSKERERRYQTAGELGRDIGHYLAGDPIEAKRDSVGYVLRKQLRRYKFPVAIAAGYVLVITGALVGTVTLWQQASLERDRTAEQRDRAVAAERQAETARAATEQQRRLAEVNAEKAEQISEFLQDMLSGLDPSTARGRDTSLLREILDLAAKRIDRELGGQPEVEATIRGTIGRTYKALGLYDAAQQHLEASFKLWERMLGIGDRQTLETLLDLGSAYRHGGRLADAEHADRQALELGRSAYGDEDALTMTARNHLAAALSDQATYDKLQAADQIVREVLTIRQRTLGESDAKTLVTMNNLAVLLQRQGKLSEAEDMLRRLLALSSRTLRDDNPGAIGFARSLVDLLREAGQLDEAERLARENWNLSRKVLRDEHPDTMFSLYELGCVLMAQGRLPEAEPYLQQVLDIRRRILGEDHRLTLASLSALAVLRQEQGQLEDAARLHQQVLDRRRSVLGDNHPDVLISLDGLAAAWMRQGAFNRAEPMFREAVDKASRVLAPGHWRTAVYQSNYGECLIRLERLEEAERQLLAAYAVLSNVLSPEDKRLRTTIDRLIGLYEAWDKPEKAALYRLLVPPIPSSPAGG